jgi:hypothetical protein
MIWWLLGAPLPLVLLLSIPTPENFWRTLALTGLAGIAVYLTGSVLIGTLLERKREYVDTFPMDARRIMYMKMMEGAEPPQA